MTLTSLMNRPVVIERRAASGETDDYGNQIDDVTTVEAVGEFQKTESRAVGEHDLLTDTTWQLFLPAGTPIDTGDAVLVDGHRYEVVGDPWHARNPRTQSASHVEVTLRRVAGVDGGS